MKATSTGLLLTISAAVALAATPAATPKKSVEPDVSKPVRVVFLNPAAHTTDERWWGTCSDLMRVAAANFDIELKISYANRSQATIGVLAEEALRSAPKPDFIVIQNMKMTAPSLIKRANEHGVKILLFNSGLSPEETKEMGAPREKYRNWIGQMLPDDEAAGYELADTIVNAAKKLGLTDQHGKVQMLALGGTVSDSSAVERAKGLERFVRSHPKDVVLNREHVLPANWERQKAKETFESAFKLFPKTVAVWNANDNMAMGVLSAAKTRFGKSPGKDIVIGGIDWNAENLKAIKAGEIAASVGGHFSECAWAMVLLHDYAKGVDFASEGISMKSKMLTISTENVAAYEWALGDGAINKLSQLDFSSFSKASNRHLRKYAFDIDGLFRQMK